MSPFDNDGNLNSDAFDSEAFDVIIRATELATMPETRSLRCMPGHLLLALCSTFKNSTDYRDALDAGLMDGFSVEEVPEVLTSYLSDTEQEQVFEGMRDEFDPALVNALETCGRIESDLGDVVWESDGPIGITALWVATLNNPSQRDLESIGPALDFARASKAFAELLTSDRDRVSVPELFASDGELQLEPFDDGAISILESASERAGRLGYDRIRPVHVFLAMLSRPDSLTEESVRLQAKPGIGPKRVVEVIEQAISLGPGVRERELTLTRYQFSENLQSILHEASVLAAKNSAQAISERFLLRAVLAEDEKGMTGRCLGDAELEFNTSLLLASVDKHIREHKLGKVREEITPFLLPRNLAKSEDLTYLSHLGQVRPSIAREELIERVLRALHKRQHNNVLITGQPGVGKTELLRELARRIADGAIPFLKRKKVLWVDCEGIAPTDSRDKFQAIVSTVKGRNDLILCLDHFENVVRFAGGTESHNRTAIKAALRNGDIHVVAILNDQDYTELFSADFALSDMFNRVPVEEMKPETATTILEKIFIEEFEKLYGVDIDRAAATAAVRTSREFIMSERLPMKAIKVLRDACEHVSFERELGLEHDRLVTNADVVRAVAERTGIDEDTIAATGASQSFTEFLAKSVIGQDEAVNVVSDQLDKIKAGATKATKPAAVFLFAGLTGTGKTELAKAIAEVYSASGKMSVYPMMNFREAHSISGILGVPPGYVGYEQGGRLINDLNADPYKVILLDEAEKAHPDIWQSMLSLFDEAWIEDRREVRAYGNRAIFILTSNAGADVITKMLRDGRPTEELKEEVGKLLIEVKNKDGQNVFSPEFLARFTDIVIFNPLSLDAMHGITRLQVDKMVKDWHEKRNKRIRIDDEVIDHVAQLAFDENEKHGGTKGGRIALKLTENLIEKPALQLMVNDREAFQDADEVRVLLEPGPKVVARIEQLQVIGPSLACERAEDQLMNLQLLDIDRLVSGVTDPIVATLERWSRHVADSLTRDQIDAIKASGQSAIEAFRRRAEDTNVALAHERDRVLEDLRRALDDRII